MNRMFNAITLIIALVVLPATAWAASGVGAGVHFEPIIGYEWVQKLVPSQHSSSRLVYGGRIIAGLPLLSAEAEYTRGSDTETFTSPAVTVTDNADRLKLGVRSSVGFLSLMSAHLRGGVQATQNQHQEVVGGVTTINRTDAISYKPYAGAGLRVGLGRRLSLSADVVAVINNINALNQTEYQTTAGFSVRLP